MLLAHVMSLLFFLMSSSLHEISDFFYDPTYSTYIHIKKFLFFVAAVRKIRSPYTILLFNLLLIVEHPLARQQFNLFGLSKVSDY